MLRHSHSVCVLVCPLGHSGYMVSNRMIVERRELREVGVAASASKIIGRLCDLSRLYSRMCVILEDDDKKGGKKMWSVKICNLLRCCAYAYAGLNQVIMLRLQCPDSILLVSVFYSVSLRLILQFSWLVWDSQKLCKVTVSLSLPSIYKQYRLV